MYYKYAEESGFSVRKGQTKKWKGVVTHKYLRCNKYGTPQTKHSFDSLSEPSMYVRQKTFTVTDCKAHIGVSFCRETCNFILSKFVEDHSNCLVDTFSDLTKISRKLSFSTKKFIHQMSLNRVVPSVAHRLLVSIKGGHHNVRGDRDSQLVIDRLKDRYECCPEYFFDFTVENGNLRSIFWAVEISKLNYKAFGHVLAFDATYQTNRYKMIFVPFTGVDHHKKCVTFGAALISSETIDSYRWLLQFFLNCHGQQPKLVLSDQDPSMRQAVVQVFSESRHRLCMWHIIKKVPAKVSGDIIENTNVRSRINRLVWNMFITPDTFESRWHYLVEKFGLQDNEWLNDMFEIRDRWVPAYFLEIHFCCLMKTTSRCESSNATFKVNSTSANTLVQFMLCMESRLDSQRYSQRSCEYKTSSVSFKSTTGEEIERHAFELYTQAIFKEVRKEIMKGKYCCYVTHTESVDAHVLYSVTHLDKRKDITNVFLVNFDPADNSASCSCMGFTRIGFLCRHVFCVYRIKKVDKIPLKYVSDRWKRDVLPRSVFSISNSFTVDSNPQSVLRFKVLEMVSQCVDMLRVGSEGLNSFAMKIKELKSLFFEKSFRNADAVDDNESVFKEIFGNVNEGDDFIENPDAVHAKGCSKVRRVMGDSEKIVEKEGKVARLCRTCGEYVHHDSRKFPLNPKNKKKKSLADPESNDNI